MLPLPVKVEGVLYGTLPGHIGRHRQWATAPLMSNIIVDLSCGGVGSASRIIGVCRIGTIGNYRSLASMPLASIKQWCFICRAIDFTL